MAFRGVQNKNGRPKGSKNVKSENVRELVQKIFQDNLPTLEEDFKALKPAERVSAMLKLASFVIPQYKSVEITEDNSGNINPIVIDFAKWK
jgi:dsRNA-specific ribonuclease